MDAGGTVRNAGTPRDRARTFGIAPGILKPGPQNALTDVPDVRVGHRTLNCGSDIRTGATAILPHGGSLWHDRVPAGVAVANGFGKLMGYTQVAELGELETPIVLTNTLSVPRAADAIIEWTLSQADGEAICTVNPLVGETNDGKVNAIEKRFLTCEHVLEAIESTSTDLPAEGNVGAGTGPMAFGWKGGIGTSSRRLPGTLSGHTVGVLVQSNFGGVLHILGVPIGTILKQHYLYSDLTDNTADGSIMIVVATDAPLSDRNLRRLAFRSFAGLARTGASFVNGSGDYAIAFSTAESVRRTPARRAGLSTFEELPNELISPLFQAVAEATEEAVYNSLFMAEAMTGRDGRCVEALPIDTVLERIRAYRTIRSGRHS